MIVITDMKVEEVLKDILQEQITIKLNNKKWKSGKFILFKQSGFFIEFIIDNGNKKEIFEIPLPFNENIKLENSKIIFDYTLETFTRGNEDLINLIDNIDHQKKSKFYNTKLYIYVHEIRSIS